MRFLPRISAIEPNTCNARDENIGGVNVSKYGPVGNVEIGGRVL